MNAIGDTEAKAKFSELLDRVGQGEEIVITRGGKPAARLVPAEAAAKTLVEGKETYPVGYHKGQIDLNHLRAVAEGFKARVKQPFSSSDINEILYDEDGLPK